MIIRCESCKTAFESEKGVVIDAEGGLVRCLQCGTVFRVSPDHLSEADFEDTKTSAWVGVSQSFSTRARLELIISALILLILALGFNAMLSLSSLEKLYVKSIVSKYSIVGTDLKRNIEKSLKFGKNINKFVNMDKLLEETRANLIQDYAIEESLSAPDLADSPRDSLPSDTGSFDVSVSVAIPNGSILYSTDPDLKGSLLPPKTHRIYKRTDESDRDGPFIHDFAKHGDRYFVTIPIFGGFSKEWTGTVVISFHEKQVNALLHKIFQQNLIVISIIVAVGFLLLAIILSMVMSRSDQAVGFPKFRITMVMLIVIGVAQIIFTGVNTNAFKDYYIRINKEKTAMLGTMLKEDIEYFLSIGRPLDKLPGLDKMLGEILTAAPELENITIFDDEGRPLYIATKEKVTNFQEALREQPRLAHEFVTTFNVDYNLSLLIKNAGETEGYIETDVDEGYISTNLSQKVIFSQLKETILDSITVLIISLLFFGELLILIFQFLEKQMYGDPTRQKAGYIAIRPAVFLYYFGQTISVSFLPLYMAQLYDPSIGMSKDMAMGLPVSVTMLFGVFSPFIAGPWVDRRGWHEPFFMGVFLTSLGFYYSWIAPDALHLIISRAFVGLGYGFTFMAANGFVIAHTDEHTRAQGLTRMVAGCFAGYICGSSTGAMLAERIGYNPVFMVGGSIILVVFAYALIFMRASIGKTQQVDKDTDVRSIRVIELFRFVFNRNIFVLSMFYIIPTAIVSVGFLHYLLPILLNRAGASQSSVGRLLMIHGIFFIYVAPFVSKYVDASSSKRRFVFVSGLVGSLAFAIFTIAGGYAATAFAVLLLGISGSLDASSAYALRLKISERVGGGKTIAVLSAMEKVGQVFGPIVFGWLLLTMGGSKGLPYVSVAYLLMSLFFILLARAPVKGDIEG